MGFMRHLLMIAIFLSGAWGYFPDSRAWAFGSSPYEKSFQSAVEQETAGNWSAAIQHYLSAMEADPSQPFPKRQIERILRQRLERGEPIEALRALLPLELDRELSQRAVFDLGRQEEQDLSFLWQIGGWFLIFLGVAGVGLLIWRKLQQREAEVQEEELLESIRSEKKRIVRTHTGETARPEFTTKKSTVVLEKTREEIEGLMSGVSSLTQEMKRPDFQHMSDEDLAKLQESDIVESLSRTLLSEVEIKEKDGLRHSKLSVDASLVFDEHDVDFFEKEFEATKEDIEAAKRKED